jgi:putative transposase
MELEQVYFYTATILDWKKLLVKDKYKDFIIDSLSYLANKGKIKVYGFVVMPNHIHLIWEMLAMNGKEMPHASLMKITGHQFLDDLRQNHPQVLPFFVVDTETRKHQFWERNSLPKLLYTPKVLAQKLDYIHANPVQEKWSLAKEPADYYYSSAKFYEMGVDDFGFITHYKERV